jgi:hypothetical protein
VTSDDSDNIQSFLPPQHKIRRMVEKFCAEAPDDVYRKQLASFIWGYCDATFEIVLKEYPEKNQPEMQDLLIEIAFWRGMYAFLRRRAGFVIADKLGFVMIDDYALTKVE